jgi:hypothetical protein
MTPPTTNLAKLQAWAERRRQTDGLEELAFYPGSDREISPEDAAWVAMELIENFDKGITPQD